MSDHEQNLYVCTAVVNKMTCAMTCAASFQLQNFRRVYVQVPLFKFRQCEDYSEQSKPYLAFDFSLAKIFTST